MSPRSARDHGTEVATKASKPGLSPSWQVWFDDDPKGGLVCELAGKGSVAQRGSRWRLRVGDSSGDRWEPRETLALATALLSVQGRMVARSSTSSKDEGLSTTAWLEKNAAVFLPVRTFAETDARIRRALRSGKVAETWKLKMRADRNSGLFAAIAGRVTLEQRGGTWLITTADGRQQVRVLRESCGLVDALVRAQEVAAVKLQISQNARETDRTSRSPKAAVPTHVTIRQSRTGSETHSEGDRRTNDRLEPGWRPAYEGGTPLGLLLVLNERAYVDAEGPLWRGRLSGAAKPDYVPSADVKLVDALVRIQSAASRGPSAKARRPLDPLFVEWLERDGKTRLPIRFLAEGHDGVRRALREGKLDRAWTVRLTSGEWRATVAELGSRCVAVQADGRCYVVHLRKPIHAELHAGRTLLDSMVAAQQAARTLNDPGGAALDSGGQPLGLLVHLG